MAINQVKASPKDIFLHLLVIITLYASSISFLILIFKYIEVLFPDKLEGGGYYYFTNAYSTIRFAISTLIVVFPVFILSSRYLNKSYDRNPAERNFRVRKWLIYFTLFVTAVIIIGDLVALINNLLGGELTTRFILKVLTVFFVAGSIFGYYLADVKKHKTA